MIRVLSVLILFTGIAYPSWSEDKDISFFDPNDWVRLNCVDLERPNKKHFSRDIVVRTDLTAIYDFIDLFDECERNGFNLRCQLEDRELKYDINRMTGELFVFRKNGTGMYECKQVEKVF